MLDRKLKVVFCLLTLRFDRCRYANKAVMICYRWLEIGNGFSFWVKIYCIFSDKWYQLWRIFLSVSLFISIIKYQLSLSLRYPPFLFLYFHSPASKKKKPFVYYIVVVDSGRKLIERLILSCCIWILKFVLKAWPTVFH